MIQKNTIQKTSKLALWVYKKPDILCGCTPKREDRIKNAVFSLLGSLPKPHVSPAVVTKNRSYGDKTRQAG